LADVERAVERMPAGEQQDRCRRLVGELAVVFGDGRAVDAVRAVALDPKASIPVRSRALETLIEARPPDLRAICEQLLGVRQLRVQAARGLALSDDPAVARLLVEACRKVPAGQREPLVSVLVSRKVFVRELLAAIAKGTLTKTDLSAFQVRQIRSLGDAELDAEVAAVWGHARETPADKRGRIERLTTELAGSQGEAGTPQPRADLGRGRLLYQRQCGSCHRLYGEGGQIGPDLTGAGRHDLGYLLENIVDPSAVVNRDWRMSLVELDDGRVLGGVIVEDRPQAVTLQSPTERFVLPRGEIASITPTDRSPMPEGLLDPLAPDEIRDLIGYLRHPTQVPLPADSDQQR
jgi:putative heme-binding domain-containing protein